MKAILVVDIDDCEDIANYGASVYHYPSRKFVQLDVPLKPLNKIVKAGDRNLIIYERAWLYSHLEEEFEMQKKARDWEKQNEQDE